MGYQELFTPQLQIFWLWGAGILLFFICFLLSFIACLLGAEEEPQDLEG